MIHKVLLMFCLICWSMLAPAASLDTQRNQFLQARAALQKGDYQEFLRLSQDLKDYSLYPYLYIIDIQKRLADISADEMTSFLVQYADSPLANQLRTAWLLQLADEESWEEFLKYYQPSSNISLTCYYQRALLATGTAKAATQDIAKLWLDGLEQNEACAPLITSWIQSGGLKHDLIWQRIRALFSKPFANRASLTALVQQLPEAERALVGLWDKIQKDPSLFTHPGLFSKPFPQSSALVIQGLERLAKRNPEQAIDIWFDLIRKYPFTKAQQQTVNRALAIALASEGNPQAADWLNKVEPSYETKSFREWRIRFALTQEDWPQVQYWIKRLPDAERNLLCWRYWLARSLEQQGAIEAATQMYQSLRQENDYYGFLASWRLHMPWQSHPLSLPVDEQELTAIKLLPGIQRAQELYALNFIIEARAEWQYALRNLNKMQLYAAAKVAQQMRWYDRAIVTAAKANAFDDLALRFPLAYQEYVQLAAQEQHLNPAWIFAVIRQESAFIPDARSSVGALGLMQLMPGTAKTMAAQLNIKLSKLVDLYNIPLNIRFGTNYLKVLYNWYQGNIILATAAYNAGPNHVQKWIVKDRIIPTDIWIDTIPWHETRDYVKAVLSYMAIYEQNLGISSSSLQQQFAD